MSVDPSATPAELAHYGAIARQLAGARRQVLELVDRCGPTDVDGLTGCWEMTSPADAERLGSRLEHLTTGLLWKLEALGWVQVDSGEYSTTGAGRAALRGTVRS